MDCRHCASPIPYKRLRRRAVYCSTQCSINDSRKHYSERNPSTNLPTGTVGAIHELVVATDLLKKGFAVFRALSPSCSCDLAILKNGKLLRIEVTTGKNTPNGKIAYPKHKAKNFDIIAIVVNDKIQYEPTLDDKN